MPLPCRPVTACPPCKDGTGCLVTFTDLPSALTKLQQPGGVISNELGPWHNLAIHSFFGIWGAPNASDYIADVDRLTSTAPTKGVIYSTADADYGPPSYFESVNSLMQVRTPSHAVRRLGR